MNIDPNYIHSEFDKIINIIKSFENIQNLSSEVLVEYRKMITNPVNNYIKLRENDEKINKNEFLIVIQYLRLGIKILSIIDGELDIRIKK